MKNNIFLVWLLFGFTANSIGQNKDSLVYYNSMQTKAIIRNKTVYSFYNKKGQLLLKYDYATEQILTDSIDKSKSFYAYEMDSNVLKAKYDVPPSINFSDCFGFSRIHIEYPLEAAEKNIEGKVIIQISIDKYGNVKTYTPIEKLGYGIEKVCIKKLGTFSKCWFPAIKNGKAIDSEINFTFLFNLD
jgi:protein TonB